MRALRWMALIVGMLGGAFGLGLAAQAAPIPVTAGLVEQADGAPVVQKARYYFYRRYYRPRFYRRYYRPRYYYRPRFYRRYYYRPRFYRRRFFYY